MDTPITATGLLAEDHRRCLEQYQQLSQEPGLVESEALIENLLKALAIHAWMEERLVYPILAKACQEELLAHRLGQAHGEMKQLISAFRLQGAGSGAEGRDLLDRLMAQFREHVQEEETQAFPLLAAGASHNEELGGEWARLQGKLNKFPPLAQTLDLAVPVRVAYDQWTQFEDFPRFLSNVKEVRQLGGTRLQWLAELGGKELRWSSEIYEQIPDNRIAWTTLEGALNAGSVSFRALDAGSCRILVELIYEPQGLLENLGAMVGVVPRVMADNLQRFKDYIERTRVASGAWRGRVEGTPLEASGGAVRAEPDRP